MTDIEKQKKAVKQRKGNTKIVRRGIRRRMNALENVMVTLIGELRAALAAVSERHDQAEILLGIMAKAHLAQETTDEELGALQEFLLKYEQSQAGVDAAPNQESAPAAE